MSQYESLKRKRGAAGSFISEDSLKPGYQTLSSDPERNRLNRVWTSMKQRCNNPRAQEYHRYGAKGIRVCSRWENSFAAFLEDMGPRPKGMTLERIDGKKNYSPENCVWATPAQQSANRDCVRGVPYQGRTIALKQYCAIIGKPYSTILARVQSGISVEEAVAKKTRRHTRGSTP